MNYPFHYLSTIRKRFFQRINFFPIIYFDKTQIQSNRLYVSQLQITMSKPAEKGSTDKKIDLSENKLSREEVKAQREAKKAAKLAKKKGKVN